MSKVKLPYELHPHDVLREVPRPQPGCVDEDIELVLHLVAAAGAPGCGVERTGATAGHRGALSPQPDRGAGTLCLETETVFASIAEGSCVDESCTGVQTASKGSIANTATDLDRFSRPLDPLPATEKKTRVVRDSPASIMCDRQRAARRAGGGERERERKGEKGEAERTQENQAKAPAYLLSRRLQWSGMWGRCIRPFGSTRHSRPCRCRSAGADPGSRRCCRQTQIIEHRSRQS